MTVQTRHLRLAPDPIERRGAEVIDRARAFIARGKKNAQAEALRAAARGFLEYPDTPVTTGQVGRKLLGVADSVEAEAGPRS